MSIEIEGGEIQTPRPIYENNYHRHMHHIYKITYYNMEDSIPVKQIVLHPEYLIAEIE